MENSGIELRRGERVRLRSLAAELDPQKALRYRIILLLAEGNSPGEVARILGISRQTVHVWRQKFFVGRLEGLETVEAARKGKPRRAGKVEKAILKLSSASRADGKAWTTRAVARRLGVSHDTVWRVWKRNDIKPKTSSSSPNGNGKVSGTRQLSNGKRGRISLKNVAREAGVSVSTASMALRGDPKVLPATRKKVAEAAQLLGYQPNPAFGVLSNMRWGRTFRGANIAFISLSKDHQPLPNNILLEGARRQAKRLGYHLETHFLSNYEDFDSLGRVLYSRGVIGVALGFIHITRMDFFRQLIRSLADYPFALVSYSWEPQEVTTLHPEVGGLMKLMRPLIVESGFSRVALSETKYSLNRIAIFKDIQRATLGKGKKAIPVFEHEEGEEAFRKWLSRHKPDLLVGREWHYDWLSRLGYRCPDDLAFICIEKNDLSRDDIAGWDLGFEEYGELGIRQLDSHIRNHLLGLPERPMTVVLEPRWIPGKSFPEQ